MRKEKSRGTPHESVHSLNSSLPERLILVPFYKDKVFDTLEDPRFSSGTKSLQPILKRLKTEVVLLFDLGGFWLKRPDFPGYNHILNLHRRIWLDSSILTPEDMVDVLVLGPERVVINEKWYEKDILTASRLSEALAYRLFGPEDNETSLGSEKEEGALQAFIQGFPLISLKKEKAGRLKNGSLFEKSAKIYTLGDNIVHYNEIL